MTRARANLSLFWHWFTCWRKRYVWLRLVIILIVCAGPVHDVFRPTIRELVVIAIEGIDTASIPSLTHHKYRYLRMKEVKRLQHSLTAHFDANHNGRLEKAEAQSFTKQTGLPLKEVTQSGLTAELDRLLAANQRLGLADRTLTPRKIRRAAFDAALQETDEFYQEYRKEIDPLLAVRYPEWRDYLHWKTWRNGLQYFLGQFLYNLWQATALEWPGWRWLLFVVLPAVVVSVARFGRQEQLARRFAEDAEFASAPCLICQEPTHDFGALRQQRLSRAITAGVAVALATYAVLVVTLPRFASAQIDAFDFSPHPPLAVPLTAGLAALLVRWIVWPWEVHACHCRPRLRWVGLMASACLVMVSVSAVLWFTAKILG